MSRSLAVSLSCLSLATVAACVDGAAPPLASSSAAVTTVACPTVATTEERSLAVTDSTALARFGLARVMTQLRASVDVTTQGNANLWKAWFRTFGTCDDPEVDPEGYGLRCPRQAERKLATVNPFAADAAVTFTPVGLFNRFDLAPSSGASCGEYRIVYAMASTAPDLGGRGFLIFEASLPNPDPSAGVDGCAPVAAFWQGLSAVDDPGTRADLLERFYFTGDAVAGAAPVVDAHHYGLVDDGSFGDGQVRTNLFVDGFEWHLREFKLRRTCADDRDATTCRLAFVHVTVKANPANELAAGTHPRSGDFEVGFLKQLGPLARGSAARIGLATDDVWNEYESVSQFGNLDTTYRVQAGADLRAAVTAKLAAQGSPLTADNIFDRATTQTCAGCHQHSNGVDLGDGVRWPSSNGFTHIDEAGRLSTALTTSFLPRRKKVLDNFLAARCDGQLAPATVDDGLTIGGSPVGAPN